MNSTPKSSSAHLIDERRRAVDHRSPISSPSEQFAGFSDLCAGDGHSGFRSLTPGPSQTFRSFTPGSPPFVNSTPGGF
jgi:hypothetical protein